MLPFHYDNCALIDLNGDTFFLYDIQKPTKTRSVETQYGRVSFKTSSMRISPKTFWKVDGYDRQFEGNDASCYLCGWHGMDYNGCKCGELKVSDHTENCRIARKNFLLQITNQFAPDFAHKVEAMHDVSGLLYGIDQYNCKTLLIDWPHWSNQIEFRANLEALLKSC